MDVKPITDELISTRDEQFPGQSEEDQICSELRYRVAEGAQYWQDNYEDSNVDRAFLAGDQWPEEIRNERQVDERPMLTINRLPQFVNHVVNDMKQNATQIKLHAVEADVQKKVAEFNNLAGTKDYSETEVLESVIRNIEYTSNSLSHYGRCTEQMVGGGFAWLRVYPEYSTDNSFEVNLRIGSVKNPTSAMIDHKASEPDYSDANWGIISEKISNEEFDKRWPNKKRGDVEASGSDMSFWGSEDMVTVTEYLSREPDTFTLYLMDNGETWSSRDIPADKINKKGGGGGMDLITNDDELLVAKQREVHGWKVVWRKMTAWSILEGGVKGIELPFTTVPLVPMFGPEIVLPDRKFISSLVRFARDPQREYNYWRSAAVEMVALQPKAPYIGTAMNFENSEKEWDNANRKNYSKLIYTPDPMNGGVKPERQPMAQNPAAEITQAMQADESIKATTGIYDASMGNVSREESGRAILARQSQSDISNFHFTSSRDAAITRVGQLVIEAVPKLYVEERIVRLRFPDDSEDFVRINHTMESSSEPGKEILVNDITACKYDVVVTSGPSYNTLRIEAVNTLIEFIQAVPEAGAMAMDIIARNMDFPGAEELADRLKKALPPELRDTGDEDDNVEEEEPPPPDPEQVLALKIEQEKNNGKQLELEKIKAENQGKAIAADVAADQVDESKVRELVAEALAELSAAQVS